MKTLLFVLALVLNSASIAQQDRILLKPVYQSGISNPEGLFYHDQNLATLGEKRGLPYVVWKVPVEPRPGDSVGFVVLMAAGSMIQFNASADMRNFHVISHFTAPSDIMQEVKVPFVYPKDRRSTFVSLHVPLKVPNSEVVGIDCAYYYPASRSKVTTVAPKDSIVVWSDILGNEFIGSERALRESGRKGPFFSRSHSVVIP